MSTVLAEIKGVYEVPIVGDIKTSHYPITTLHVSQFSGGEKRGKCMQLDIRKGNHIQLERTQVLELLDSVLDYLRDTIGRNSFRVEKTPGGTV